MTSIMTWNVPLYRRGALDCPAVLVALGRAILTLDFARRHYAITLQGGEVLRGVIHRYYAGRIYQSYGMFGFSSQDTVFVFGENETFYPGRLWGTRENTGDLVWLAETGKSGPLLRASRTPELPEGLAEGRRDAPMAYLSGTMIATPSGARAVETLTVGERIIVWREGKAQSEEIVRTGSVTYEVDRMQSCEDEAGYPVCIRKNALGAGTPTRDLHVHGGHCVHVENCVVPVHMLVNGVTILYDRTISSYTGHHLRLARHGLIEAEGMAGESWLTTGTHLVFQKDQADPSFEAERTRPLIWSHEACAPLNVERHFVQALWERLSPVSARTFLSWRRTTHEPDLHLRQVDGSRIYPYRRRGRTYLFYLRGTQRRWSLCSRQVRPCDETGPFINDRRRYGVLVSNATLWTSARVTPLMLDRLMGAQEGWYEAEGKQGYWTDGASPLALGEECFDGDEAIILSITLAATRLYPVHFTEKPTHHMHPLP
ncbi:Hint domain-containing protein [Asaia krungthepensis]|uniref:Hedgehog/Intein (Hint) domain-containing protein n=1 Tax=Asaia krungthepensis NRIC 0535 TaxID=1307925 RepID=A0ABQ0Q0J2_9PROT|nr:Hint domain-containing protein [Asaia krungthepensis]GBQ86139.1 hypothetical protein AA0535_0943 [Asaia krungthepensis NRIC 0535]